MLTTQNPSIQGQEPPMYLARPSSGRSQDVTHVLARTFRELFTRETISAETIENLKISRGDGDDAYHERYVEALQKVHDERERRMAQASMLERHIMQAQARAMSADEREVNRKSSGFKKYPNLGLPPARSHFRSCIDSALLRQHHLITPEDFATEEPPPVPPPMAPKIPSYARETTNSIQHAQNTSDENIRISPLPDIMYSSIESDISEYARLPKLTEKEKSPRNDLWKAQLDPETREINRKDLANLQARANYLKNPRYIPPSAKGGGRTLIKPNKKKPKEIGIKAEPEIEKPREPSVVFIPSPDVVTFTNYRVGQVYEAVLELKNVSASLRQCRVIPPKTTYFSVGLGQFPGEHGLVAPGMKCQYAIRFIPDSLGDYDDEIKVQTQSTHPLVIKIQARRQPPQLSIPHNLDVGQCLVGGCKVIHIPVHNTGGAGRFCLMPRSVWPTTNFKSVASLGCVNLPPFEIRPSVFELMNDELMMLEVIFTPPSIKTYTQTFTMACDNCHIKHFTIHGEGQTAGVEFVSVDGGKSEPLPGELCDVAAQHMFKFDTLNPFTYTQKQMVVKNTTNVELPYNWKVIKPHLQYQDPGSEDTAIPSDRVVDLDSAFSIEPQAGTLPPFGEGSFIVTFAPPEIDNFHSVLHLILQQIPESPAEPEEEEDEMVQRQEPMRRDTRRVEEEVKVKDVTALEVEVKGQCEEFKVMLYPYAVYVPGKMLVGTSMRKHFQLINNSHSAIVFEWDRVSSPFILQVEPPMGELEPECAMDCELNITGAQAGLIDHTLLCHVENLNDPLPLHVHANVKGPEVLIDEPGVNFDLVKLGQSVTREISVRNICQVCARSKIEESSAHLEGSQSDFIFDPSYGELKPLEVTKVSVIYTPSSTKSLRTVFMLTVEDGNECNIGARAEVQTPQACLLSSKLTMKEVYVDVPVTYPVIILNQTYLETSFEWGELEGDHASLCSVKMNPSSGELGPREQVEVQVTFTAHKEGKMCDLRVPCYSEGMSKPLALALHSHVKGLTVSYRTSVEKGDYSTAVDDLDLNFGDDLAIGANPKRYLYIKNNSAIAAPYSFMLEYFNARPPTPPSDKKDFMPNKGQRKSLLSKTQNLADPSSKSSAKAFNEMCQILLKEGKGAAFTVQPSSGVLQPFAEEVIEITGYSDMWGEYSDKLICKVQKLDVVTIPVQMTVIGCPLQFQMVATQPGKNPYLRFGTHVSGVPSVNRQMRINNPSPYDIRVDWQLFNIQAGDRQLLDLVMAAGNAFPLKDSQGNEIICPPYTEPKPTPRQPTDMIADSADSTPKLSRADTTNDAGQDSESPDEKSLESQDQATKSHDQSKLIRVYVRPHEGVKSEQPFSIVPEQLIIPARGVASVTARFTPFANADVVTGFDCNSYAMGYMSLDEKSAKVEDKISRLHGYEMVPLRLDMTAHVKPALLTIECVDDEGMRYRTAASDLLKNGKVGKESFKVCSTNISNQTETPLTFKLVVSSPYQLLELDSSGTTPGRGRVQETDMCTLNPQHNMQVKVAFRVSLDLVGIADTLEPDQERDGVTLTVHEGERKIHFRQDLQAVFNNGTIQRLPLYATLTVPSIVLSKESIDFGTCLVGQERMMELLLTNRTASSSFWTAVIETKSSTCTSDTFRVSPSSGLLDAHITYVSNSKVLLKVTFVAKHTEAYEAVFLLQGMLGEEPRRLYVKGQGSYDERHEALVNV